MPKEIYEDNNSLYNQMKRFKMNPDEVQRFFDENGIDINIKKQTGLENVLRLGASSHLDLPNHKEPNEFFFGEKDMTKIPTGSHMSYTNWQYYLYQFVNQLQESADKKQARIYVYKKGEQYPRELSYDKNAKKMTLSEPANISLKPPKKPAAFGWKNFFKNFSDRYRREIEEYNHKLDIYNNRRKFFENPAAARQQRWREEQNKEFEVQNVKEDTLKQVALDPALREIGHNLDDRFGGIEKKTANMSDRLDNVVIGGKTLRQLVLENICNAKPDKDGKATFDEKGVRLYQKKTPDELHAIGNSIIVKAMLSGVSVKAAKLDPVTGEMLADEKGALFTELKVPSEIAKIAINSPEHAALNRLIQKDTNVTLTGLAEGKELLIQTDITCKNIQTLNKANAVLSSTCGYVSMQNALLGGWAKDNGHPTVKEGLKTVKSYDGFTTDRSCIPSHAIAYLITQGHSMKDICDPSKLAEEKDAAGREAMKRYLDHDKKWMAEVNVKAQQKIVEETDKAFKNVDFYDNKSVFTKETMPYLSMVHTVFDLQQEKDHMKQEVLEAVAKQNNLDVTKPEDLAKTKEISGKLTEKAQVLSAAKVLSLDTRAASQLVTGDTRAVGTKMSEILNGQLCRSKFTEAQKNNRPLSEYSDPETSNSYITSGGFFLMHDSSKNKGAPGSLGYIQSSKSFATLREFGNSCTNCALSKNCNMDIWTDKSGKTYTTFEKKEQQPAVEVKDTANVLQNEKNEMQMSIN